MLLPMPLENGPSTGAPLSIQGPNPLRVLDADFTITELGRFVCPASAPRVATLPPLSTVAPGGAITIKSSGASTVTGTGSGTDPVNDAGAPGTAVVAAGLSVTFVKTSQTLPPTATAQSWITFNG